MTMHVGVGGAYKDVLSMGVGVSGAWKAVQSVHVGVGGAWKMAYVLLVADPIAADGEMSASISFKNDGTATSTSEAGFTWLPDGDESDYEIYVTGTGVGPSSTPTGAAVDMWLNLGTTRTWSLTTSGAEKSFVGSYQIRHTSGVVLGTDSFIIVLAGPPV